MAGPMQYSGAFQLQRGGILDYDKVYSVVMNDIKNGIIKGITFDRSNS